MEDQYFIQELIEQKDFVDLSTTEKSEVLKYITEEEYTLRRHVVLDAHLHFTLEKNNMVLNDGIKQRAHALLATNNKHKGFVYYKIPVWQAAAVVAGILFTAWALYGGKNKQVEYASIKPAKKQIVYVKDTVFVEREVPKEIIVEKTKVEYKEIVVEKEVAPKVPDGFDQAMNDELRFKEDLIKANQGVNFEKDLYIQQIKNSAKPITDQPELKQFLVVSR